MTDATRTDLQWDALIDLAIACNELRPLVEELSHSLAMDQPAGTEGGQRQRRFSHLLDECARRVSQLGWLCQQIRTMHRHEGRLLTPEVGDYIDHGQVTLVEAFYYFAFRLYTVLEFLKQRGCPRFQAYISMDRQLVGLRNIRNRLIEHPEKTGGSLAQDFAWSIERGIYLKPFAEEPLDEGFLHNATVFFQTLHSRLSTVVVKPPTPDATVH